METDPREQGDDCLICGRPVPDYVADMCCGGHDCACQGQPLNPCLCSEECGHALFDINGTYEARRIRAGIPTYQEWLVSERQQMNKPKPIPNCTLVSDLNLV